MGRSWQGCGEGGVGTGTSAHTNLVPRNAIRDRESGVELVESGEAASPSGRHFRGRGSREDRGTGTSANTTPASRNDAHNTDLDLHILGSLPRTPTRIGIAHMDHERTWLQIPRHSDLILLALGHVFSQYHVSSRAWHNREMPWCRPCSMLFSGFVLFNPGVSVMGNISYSRQRVTADQFANCIPVKTRRFILGNMVDSYVDCSSL